MLGADGYPIFVTSSAVSDGFSVIDCGDASCSNSNLSEVRYDPASADYGEHVSIVLDGDGLPYIGHVDGDAGNARILHCAVDDCSSTGSVVLSGGLNLGSTTTSWRGLFVASINVGKAAATFTVTDNGEVRVGSYATAQSTSVCVT